MRPGALGGAPAAPAIPAAGPRTSAAAERPPVVVAVVTCHEDPPGLALVRGVLAHVDAVLVVADGPAPAATGGLAALGDLPGVGLLELPSNRGKGWALAAALAELRGVPGRCVLTIDGDGQHPVAAIPAFLAAAGRAELVIGDRRGRRGEMPGYRRLANAAASAVLGARTGGEVRDSQCGMRLLRGRALEEVPFPGGGYEAETDHLRACLRAGVGVAWVPIPAQYRGEPSSFRPVRDTWRVTRSILRR